MTERPSGSAERLIFLLKLVAESDREMSLSEIAERSAMPISSAHRLLQVLVKAHILERGDGQSYRVGLEYHRIASALLRRFDLARYSKPFLQDLVDEWNETAVLCTYNPVARRAIVTERMMTSHPLRFGVDIGLEIELPWGSLGRAVLAHLPAGVAHAILHESHAGPLSGKPRPAYREMDHIMADIRAEGFAHYCDPDLDLAGIAAPIFGIEDKIIGCIGITMPSERFQYHQREKLGRSISEAAQELSSMAEA